MNNQSFAGKRSFRTLLSIVLVLSLLISIFATTTLADATETKDVTIVDGTKAIAVTTTETEPLKILKTAGVVLESSDKVDITAFGENGGEIKVNRLKNITIDNDGDINEYQVYSTNVGTAIKDAGISIDANDGINFNLTDEITEGMVIMIKRAINVSITDMGKKYSFLTIDETVEDVLNTSGITLGENDYTKPALDTELEKDMSIKVYRVEYKTEKEEKVIKFTTKEEKDKTLLKGTKKTITKGKDGKEEISYRVRIVNGKEESREETDRKVIEEAVEEVVKIGTKKVEVDVTPNGVKSKNGISLGDKISGRYTHYCACATCNGNSRGITTSGRRIQNGMKNPYYIACNWLPLGSVIKTQGHYYTVVDRGGSGLSRKGRIDIFTPGGHSACYRLGTGNCTIEIIRLGW